MDGYAVRLAEAATGRIPLAGEVRIGKPAVELPAGKSLRLFTGCPIPAGAEAVLPREFVEERGDYIDIVERPAALAHGWHIRRRGENAAAGSEVVAAGAAITPGVVAALSGFGIPTPLVHRRVRVGLLTTGDELVRANETPKPWQIRDSNLASLAAMVHGRGWLELVESVQLRDDDEALRITLADLLKRCDAVLMSGGVSVGTYDFVPEAVRDLGGEVVFHRLPIRPGKPILGAVGSAGQAIFGLPGNPISTPVTARRFAMTALRRLAGFTHVEPARPAITLRSDGAKIDLWWYRLVRLVGQGEAEPVPSRSSGDIAALATSDGFVEIPRNRSEAGPWPYFGWEDLR
jgi:molybdopterin molybdotransferase